MSNRYSAYPNWLLHGCFICQIYLSQSHYFWMFCVVFIWGGLCGLLLLAMSGHLFDWGIKLIVKLWNTPGPLTMYILTAFFKTHRCSNWCLFLTGISSDSNSGCFGTRLWRQQTTRHINVCSHRKYHCWRLNQTCKRLLQSILPGYLNSRAIIILKSTRARREDQQLVASLWTSPCISNGASGCSQFVFAYRLVLETIRSGEFQDGDFLKKVNGFRKLHSIELAALEFTDRISHCWLACREQTIAKYAKKLNLWYFTTINVL